MIRMQGEPKCTAGFRHDFVKLGTEDNGEVTWRCNTCLALKYIAPDRSVRHEEQERRQR